MEIKLNKDIYSTQQIQKMLKQHKKIISLQIKNATRNWNNISSTYNKKEEFKMYQQYLGITTLYLQQHLMLEKQIKATLQQMCEKKINRECAACTKKIHWLEEHSVCLDVSTSVVNCGSNLTDRIRQNLLS